MTQRRYSEDEVAEIFERAAEEEATGSKVARQSEGRTLAELKAIGAEAGLPPELVARAAESLDRAGEATRRSFLGFPLTVRRSVELGREVTEEEWERLVADLRVTFNAQGRVSENGPYRQWRNGNLRAVLEPATTGHRLRIETMKGDARSLMTTGLVMSSVALVLALTFVLTGGAAGDWPAMLILILTGAGLFGAGALQLPGWAATRLGQMEEVAGRLAEPSVVEPD